MPSVTSTPPRVTRLAYLVSLKLFHSHTLTHPCGDVYVCMCVQIYVYVVLLPESIMIV